MLGCKQTGTLTESCEATEGKLSSRLCSKLVAELEQNLQLCPTMGS